MYFERLPIINGKHVLNDDFVYEQFEKIAKEITSGNKDADLSFVLEGFSGDDLEEVDMSGLSLETFRRLTFDSNTKFPNIQIEGIDIGEIVKKFIE